MTLTEDDVKRLVEKAAAAEDWTNERLEAAAGHGPGCTRRLMVQHCGGPLKCTCGRQKNSFERR